VQLGLMMVVNLSIGLYTPPVGTTLFISAAIARVGLFEVVRALVPFYLVALAVLMAISFIPALTIY
jgi:TRAP-type C4-dicarboxylate transport system permease large subunit